MQPHEIAAAGPTFAQTVLLVAVFAAVVLGFINILRLIASVMLHRTIRRALDSDPTSAAPLIERLAASASGTGDDGRLSVILVSIGIAMVVASVVIGNPGWVHYGVASALFPLIVGTALWLRQFVIERSRERDGGQ